MYKTRALMKFRFMERKHSLNGAPNFRIYHFLTYSLVLHLIERGFFCAPKLKIRVWLYGLTQIPLNPVLQTADQNQLLRGRANLADCILFIIRI